MWIKRAWQHISPKVSNVRDETYNDMLWNDREEDGKLGVSVRKMKALTVKMKTVPLVGKGTQNVICFVLSV